MSQYNLIRDYDFNDGVIVSKQRIDNWHREVVEKLKDQKNNSWSSVASGNSIVIGYKNGDGDITVYEVTNGYKVFEYENKVL